jgi:uncharacterized OB-fold protein
MAAERLELREFPGPGDGAALLPPRTPENAPHWEGLRERRLLLQRCGSCARARYPVAPVCPHCGAGEYGWDELSGAGSVHSWVRYRRAYLPQFEPLVPYEVLCVSLEHGPRVFGRLVGESGGGDPEIGTAVQALVERFAGGDCVLAFRVR